MLTRDRKATPGIAHRAGSWLARKIFVLGKASSNASFNIIPVKEDWFVDHKLPPTTAYYIQLTSENFNVPCSEITGLVAVYMSEALHSTLARDENSATSRAVIKTVYADVVSTIISMGVRNLEGEEIADNSILRVAIDRLAKESKFSKEKILEYAADTRLKTVVQAAADLSRVLIVAAARRSAQ